MRAGRRALRRRLRRGARETRECAPVSVRVGAALEVGLVPNVRTVEGVDRPIMIRKLGFCPRAPMPTDEVKPRLGRARHRRGIRRRARVSTSHIAPEPDSLQLSFHPASRHLSIHERGR